MDLFDDDMDEFSEGFDRIFEAPSTCYSFPQDFQDEDESDDADFQRTCKFCEEKIEKIKNQLPHPTRTSPLRDTITSYIPWQL